MAWGQSVQGIIVGGAVTVLLTACGSARVGSPLSSPADDTPTSLGSHGSLPPPKAPPAGYRWQHSDRAGLDVAVPTPWLAVSAADISANGENVAEYAQRLGLTLDQARQAVASGLEVVVRDPASAQEVRLLVFDRIVTPALLENTLEKAGSTKVHSETYPSPTGFNAIAWYDIQGPSGPMSCRAMLAFLKNPTGRSAVVQACSDDEAATQALVTKVFQGTKFA